LILEKVPSHFQVIMSS